MLHIAPVKAAALATVSAHLYIIWEHIHVCYMDAMWYIHSQLWTIDLGFTASTVEKVHEHGVTFNLLCIDWEVSHHWRNFAHAAFARETLVLSLQMQGLQLSMAPKG